MKKTRKKRFNFNFIYITPVVIVLFLSASFIVESLIKNIAVNYDTTGLVVLIAMVIIIIIQINTPTIRLAFSVPFVLLLFYIALMMLGGWYNSSYFTVCIFLCVISCLYKSFNRTLAFVIVQNILIGILLLNDLPIAGVGISLYSILIYWIIYLFCSIVLLTLARSSTTILNKALEYQDSFINLLDTTENYIAMINERNEVVYASKTLSQLGNTEDPVLVQGRSIIDLFPGRTLKVYAARLLSDKNDYQENWEFSLEGQKQYFKATSLGLPGEKGEALINLYDMTHLAERDEISIMKDNMQIGLFFMDNDYVIQDHYSRYMEEMFSDTKLFGKVFTDDLISDSVSESEMNSIRDYLKMIFERTYDQEILEEINPLTEFHYANKTTRERKVFQFAFARVDRGRGEVLILVTVYDITAKVHLAKRLEEEEIRRQEEMQSVFELIQIEPGVFHDFMQDMEQEFDNIDIIHKDELISSQDVLVKIYQSIHAIKSNAVILGLNVFSNKAHNLESKIKKLREIEGDVPFTDMLNLTMDIEKLFLEKEAFRDIIDKLQVYAGNTDSDTDKQNVKVLLDSLEKTTEKSAEGAKKRIKFIASEIEPDAVEKGPRRIMKEILIQLIRNSAIHGIELPKDRTAKGKKETGIIKLSIKMTADQKHIHIKLTDDGNGLDYKKIAEKAINKKLIKKADAGNNDVLTKLIFAPGFSTSDTEGLYAGRGIGLNLVRDRLHEVNGSVKLRSESGKGIVFQISIPAVKL